jgi:hypothetical protein
MREPSEKYITSGLPRGLGGPMTVGQLIDRLRNLPDDWEVEPSMNGHGLKLFQPNFRWEKGQRYAYLWETFRILTVRTARNYYDTD